MKFILFSLIFLISLKSYSQEISNVRVFAESPVCFDSECFVSVNFIGFDTLHAELFLSGDYPRCGIPQGNDFEPSTIGTSRTSVTIKAQGIPVAKLCNAGVMPAYSVKSQFPTKVLKFNRNEIPSLLEVKIKDRKLMKAAKFSVYIPIAVDSVTSAANPDCSDGVLSYFSPTQIIQKNKVFAVKDLYNYCYDVKSIKRLFHELSTVNKGNASCSDLKMKVISPSGKEYVSWGSQPGAYPSSEIGRYQVKFFLNYGCDRYDMYVTF